jgi:hypothetical protein
MLTMPGQRKIYQIPDQVIANYRYFVENDEEPVTAAPVPLKKGIKVRVVSGSMKGVEAYVQSYNGKKAVIGSEIKYISGATLTISRNLLEVVEEDCKTLKRMAWDGRDSSISVQDDLDNIILGYHMNMIPDDAAKGILLLNQYKYNSEDFKGFDNYPDISQINYFKQ